MAINHKTIEFINENGAWTAMAIMLSDGTYTREPTVDHRLRRLVQNALDIVKKPISDCRVLDLACLEGQYGIEFALHGAEVIGIEGRAVSVAKCNYVKDDLNLERLRFYQDDVRALSKEKYGSFDIVICSGILYHLTANDALRLVQSIASVCTGIVLIDTFVSLFGPVQLELADGTIARGHHYFEHNEHDEESVKEQKLWASLDNADSFWFTEPTLVNMLTKNGFTSVANVLSPTMPGNPIDRKTYLAIKGQQARILSSEKTWAAPIQAILEGENTNMDASQRPRGRLFRFAKRVLPPSIKNKVKPVLRAAKILPPDTTPEFQKKRNLTQPQSK